MSKKLSLDELKVLVFEKGQATKQNKDQLFKRAKAEQDIDIIEKMRDILEFKSARVYLEKLSNLTLNNAIKNQDIKLLANVEKNDRNLLKVNFNELIKKKYCSTF